MKLGAISGVYRLMVGDQFYIGSSENINIRIKSHHSELKRGQHTNRKLQQIFNACNGSLFCYDILEIAEKEHLQSRERYYVDVLNPQLNGTNLVHRRTDYLSGCVKRDASILFKCTQHEKELIKNEAKSVGLSSAMFIRFAINKVMKNKNLFEERGGK